MLGISFAVPLHKRKRIEVTWWLEIVCGIAMYSMIFPLAFMDIATTIFQTVYFPIYDLPKTKRSDYIRFDRQKLSRLNFTQKLACVYCDYANGISAWVKTVFLEAFIFELNENYNINIEETNNYA